MSATPRQRPVALVTGGSRGIGRAICEALAPDHHVVVGGRSVDAVAPVLAALPSAEPFVCDLTDEDSTAAAVAGLDRLDVLVHSAGVADPGTVASAPRDMWRRTLELNVVAVAGLTRLVLPLLRQAHGQIVMINSGAGFTAGPGNGPYAASKFALRALTDALRAEERGRIRVIAIHPGRVDTDMQVHLQTAAGREYVPEEHLRPQSVAEAVVYALGAPPDAIVESLTIRPIERG